MSDRRWTSVPTEATAEIPARRSSAAVLRVKLIVVVTLLTLAVVAGPASFLLVLGRHTPAPVAIGSTNSMTTAAAQVVAADFLDGRPTQIAVANGSGTDSPGVSAGFGYPSLAAPRGRLAYESLVFAGDSQRTDLSVTYELDYFLVETTSALYTLTVPMLDTPYGPMLGALPSLTTYVPPTTNATDPLDYDGDQGYTPGNNAYPTDAGYIQDLVDAWATAFASGDQAGLQAVAKYAQQPVYPALGGFTAGTPVIRSEVATPTGLYVRVAVPLARGAFRTTSEYDLLLANADTAAPSVVSWGPAGAAPLAPFS